MLEFVYRLNLPLLMEKLRPNLPIDYFNPKNTIKSKFYFGDSSDFFVDRPNIKNIEWDIYMYVQKPEKHVGDVHTDTQNNKFCPAINIIFSGSGKIEFWENVDSLSINGARATNLVGLEFTKSNLKNPYTIFDEPSIPATKSYTLNPGIFLLNAGVPHRVISADARHLISLRSSTNDDKDWNYIVDKFSDCIVP